MESRGAEVYSNACTASIAIEDDEPEIPSAMGFAETEIWADKSAGTVRIPLMRESEGLQYVTGVDYETENGTAVAGTDYAAISSGTALFPSDLDFTYIEIDLVNDGILLEPTSPSSNSPPSMFERSADLSFPSSLLILK